MKSQVQSKSYLKALAKGENEMKKKSIWQKMSFWPTLARKTHEKASWPRLGHLFYPENHPKSKSMMKFMLIEFKFIERTFT